MRPRSTEHLTVARPSDETRHKALHGLTRTPRRQHGRGRSTRGIRKSLEIQGVGYKAELKPYGVQPRGRLFAPGHDTRRRRASSSRVRDNDAGDASKAPTRSWSARWPRRFATSGRRSRTRARGSGTTASTCAARPARQERSNASRFIAQDARGAALPPAPPGAQAGRGNAERPRLVVFRSLKHIYAQLVE